MGPLFKTFSKVEGIDLNECIVQLSKNAKQWKQISAMEEGEEAMQVLSEEIDEVSSESGTAIKYQNIMPVSPRKLLSPIVFDPRISGQTSPMVFEADSPDGHLK